MPNDHKDLVVWQLADQLRTAVLALTETGPASRDLKYRDQLRDAVSSVGRNLAEGFYRYDHPEFANFTRYARASLGETQDLLHEGRKRHYWDEAQTREADSLARRTMIGVSRLHRYLRSTVAPSTGDPHPRSKR
jgi:four helix bundle protein